MKEDMIEGKIDDNKRKLQEVDSLRSIVKMMEEKFQKLQEDEERKLKERDEMIINMKQRLEELENEFGNRDE